MVHERLKGQRGLLNGFRRAPISAPAAARVLGGREELGRARFQSRGALAANRPGSFLESNQHLRCLEDRVLFLARGLVSEPKRDERTIAPLGAREKSEPLADRALDA